MTKPPCAHGLGPDCRMCDSAHEKLQAEIQRLEALLLESEITLEAWYNGACFDDRVPLRMLRSRIGPACDRIRAKNGRSLL